MVVKEKIKKILPWISVIIAFLAGLFIRRKGTGRVVEEYQEDINRQSDRIGEESERSERLAERTDDLSRGLAEQSRRVSECIGRVEGTKSSLAEQSRRTKGLLEEIEELGL